MPSVEEILKTCEEAFSDSITKEGFTRTNITPLKRRILKALKTKEFFGLYSKKGEMGITFESPQHKDFQYITYAVKGQS